MTSYDIIHTPIVRSIVLPFQKTKESQFNDNETNFPERCGVFDLCHKVDHFRAIYWRLNVVEKNSQNNSSQNYSWIELTDVNNVDEQTPFTIKLRIQESWIVDATFARSSSNLSLCLLSSDSTLHIIKISTSFQNSNQSIFDNISEIELQQNHFQIELNGNSQATKLMTLPDNKHCIVGYMSGSTSCVALYDEFKEWPLESSSVIGRLFSGLTPTFSSNNSSVLALDVLCRAPLQDRWQYIDSSALDSVIDVDTFVVGVCADYTLRVWSTDKRVCLLTHTITLEPRTDRSQPPTTLEQAHVSCRDGRIVVAVDGQCLVYELCFDGSAISVSIDGVLFCDQVDNVALDTDQRVWLLQRHSTAQTGAHLVWTRAPVMQRSDVATSSRWHRVACGDDDTVSLHSSRLNELFIESCCHLDEDDFEEDPSFDLSSVPKTIASWLIEKYGVVVIGTILQNNANSIDFGTNLSLLINNKSTIDRINTLIQNQNHSLMIDALCSYASKQFKSNENINRHSLFRVWCQIARVCSSLMKRLQRPIGVAIIASQPCLILSGGIAFVRDSSIAEQFLFYGGSKSHASSIAIKSSDKSVNVARRRGVSKLLQTISLAREEIGVESMFLLQQRLLQGEDIGAAAYPFVAQLIAEPQSTSSSATQRFAALRERSSSVDALLLALEHDTGQVSPIDSKDADAIEDMAKQLMSMSGGYLGRRLASEWCIGSSRAAINIILPLLLLLYTAARSGGVDMSRLRDISLPRAYRLLLGAISAKVTLCGVPEPDKNLLSTDNDDSDFNNSNKSKVATVSLAETLLRRHHSALCLAVSATQTLSLTAHAASLVQASVSVGQNLLRWCRSPSFAACLLISDDQSSAVRRLAQATPTALQSDPVLRHCNAVALLLSAGMASENERRSKKTLSQSIEFACREFEACGAALTRDELRRCIAARDDVLPLPDEPVLPTDVEMAHPDSWLLANYYLHVMHLFELQRRLSKSSYFAELAFPYALAVDRRAASYVRAAAFRHCLADNDAFGAYRWLSMGSVVGQRESLKLCTIIKSTDVALTTLNNNTDDEQTNDQEASRWHADALRRLVIVLCERGQIQTLCALPWSSDADHVHQLLLEKARRAPLDAIPNYYSIAFAFATCRGDYRRAAAAQYELATRLHAEQPNHLQQRVAAYDATLASLRLLTVDDRWLARPAPPSVPPRSPKRAADGTLLDTTWSHGADDVLGQGGAVARSLRAVERERTLAAAWLALSGTHGSADEPQANSDDDTLSTAARDAAVLLCRVGDYRRAATLLGTFELDTAPLFDSLAARMAQESADTPLSALVSHDADWHAAGTSARPPPAVARDAVEQTLQCYLQQCKSSAKQNVARERVASFLLSNDEMVRLPCWLRNSMKSNDCASLMRVYLANCRKSNVVLDDACELARDILQSHQSELAAADQSKRQQFWLPLNLIDLLLDALADAANEAESVERSKQLTDEHKHISELLQSYLATMEFTE